MIRLSIIIPAYNSSDYLESCVTSCEEQDIEANDFEVIIIDDGSKDNTLKVALGLAKKYHNIIVLSQKNQGQSVARNKALEMAQGRYVSFVDSDDTLEKNSLNELLSLAEHNNLDILYFLMNVQDEKGKWTKSSLVSFAQNTLYTGEYAIMHANPAGACASRLFKREFLDKNHLHFYPGIIHEDAEFTTKAFSIASRVMFTSINAYNYAYNFGSTTRTTNYDKLKKNIFDDIVIARNIKDFAIQRTDLSDELRSFLLKDSNSVFISALLRIYFNKDKTLKSYTKDFMSESKRMNLLPVHGKSLSWKTTCLIPIINTLSKLMY